MDDYGAYDDPPRRPKWLEYLTFGIPAGSVFGIRVRLHILLLAVLIYEYAFVSHLPLRIALPFWAFNIIALFGSVLLHELGHCYGAFRVGGEVQQIVLWPLGGLAVASGAEKGPRQELIVTILGPAVSLALAIVFTVLWWIVEALGASIYIAFPIRQIMRINWMLFLFNLLTPLFPMDCARLIRGATSYRWHPNRVTYHLTTVGVWLGGTIAILGFFSHAIERALVGGGMPGLGGFIGAFGPITGFIGLFGAFASWQERKMCQMMDVYEDGPWYWRHSMFRSETAPGSGDLWADIKDGLKRLRKPPANRSPARIIELNSGKKETSAHKQSAKSRRHSQRQPKTRESSLRDELDRAVAEEDFPKAARLRDELKKLNS